MTLGTQIDSFLGVGPRRPPYDKALILEPVTIRVNLSWTFMVVALILDGYGPGSRPIAPMGFGISYCSYIIWNVEG